MSPSLRLVGSSDGSAAGVAEAPEAGTRPGDEALDAYSRTVTAVAERLAPAVASLRRPVNATTRAGVREGDLVLELNGTPVQDATDLQRMMVAELIGRSVPVLICRAGRELRLELTPEELPES